MIFHAEQSIAAPIDRVWRHLIEPDLIVTWMPGVTAIRTPSNAPLTAGMTFRATARSRDQASTVIMLESGRRLALQSTQGAFTVTYTYTITATGDTTQATLSADCVATGIARLLKPLIAFAIRHADAGSLARLRTAVEDAPPSS